jgi:hypothetical protein
MVRLEGHVACMKVVANGEIGGLRSMREGSEMCIDQQTFSPENLNAR